MSLIPCPDCGRMVSRAAASCPDCGRPFAWAPRVPAKVKPTRGGRGLRLAGGVVMFLAGVPMVAGLLPATFGAAGLLLGLLVYLAGRVAGGG